MYRILIALALVAMASGPAFADMEGSAVATVHVGVDRNVSVGVNTPIVDAGTVQVEEFSATISFRVDANVEVVHIYICASDLFKGGIVSPLDVAPIPVSGSGALIEPVDAGPLPVGRSNTAVWLTGQGGPVVDGFPTRISETIAFESKQDGHFSQDVNVTVQWDQADPEKPEGVYWGRVKFVSLILDGSEPSEP